MLTSEGRIRDWLARRVGTARQSVQVGAGADTSARRPYPPPANAPTPSPATIPRLLVEKLPFVMGVLSVSPYPAQRAPGGLDGVGGALSPDGPHRQCDPLLCPVRPASILARAFGRLLSPTRNFCGPARRRSRAAACWDFGRCVLGGPPLAIHPCGLAMLPGDAVAGDRVANSTGRLLPC